MVVRGAIMSGRIMTMKTPEEFGKMEVAGACVAAVHDAIREAAVPGASMKELDAIATEVYRDRDCRPSFLNYHGFPATICAVAERGDRPRHPR